MDHLVDNEQLDSSEDLAALENFQDDLIYRLSNKQCKTKEDSEFTLSHWRAVEQRTSLESFSGEGRTKLEAIGDKLALSISQKFAEMVLGFKRFFDKTGTSVVNKLRSELDPSLTSETEFLTDKRLLKSLSVDGKVPDFKQAVESFKTLMDKVFSDVCAKNSNLMLDCMQALRTVNPSKEESLLTGISKISKLLQSGKDPADYFAALHADAIFPGNVRLFSLFKGSGLTLHPKVTDQYCVELARRINKDKLWPNRVKDIHVQSLSNASKAPVLTHDQMKSLLDLCVELSDLVARLEGIAKESKRFGNPKSVRSLLHYVVGVFEGDVYIEDNTNEIVDDRQHLDRDDQSRIAVIDTYLSYRGLSQVELSRLFLNYAVQLHRTITDYVYRSLRTYS